MAGELVVAEKKGEKDGGNAELLRYAKKDPFAGDRRILMSHRQNWLKIKNPRIFEVLEIRISASCTRNAEKEGGLLPT